MRVSKVPTFNSGNRKSDFICPTSAGILSRFENCSPGTETSQSSFILGQHFINTFSQTSIHVFGSFKDLLDNFTNNSLIKNFS